MNQPHTAHPDLLHRYKHVLQWCKIENFRKTAFAQLENISFWSEHRQLIQRLDQLGWPRPAFHPGEVTRVGEKDNLSEAGHDVVDKLIKGLIPWRIGPFDICGHPIDSEWVSTNKWKRITPLLPSLAGTRIVDIGCNNGFFMFQLSALEPEIVVGLDPVDRCFYQFDLLQRFASRSNLHYEYAGVEQLEFFPAFFDVALCLGVLYHRRNPVDTLKVIAQSLKPGGVLIIESMGIPGEALTPLIPNGRYAKMRNAWCIPTLTVLIHWLEQAGFESIECAESTPTMPSEQRRTTLAHYESLEDFLDPNDPSQTIEGYPAPIRILCKAVIPAQYAKH